LRQAAKSTCCESAVKIQNKQKKRRIKMKFVKVMLTAAVVLSATTSFALTIKNTKHDLSASGAGTSYKVAGETQVCKFCHVPHNAKASTLLWARNASNQPTAFYSNTETMNATAGAVGATSLLCLSCHDGVAVAGNAVLTGSAKLGTNLYNTHPIGINYGAGDTALNTVAAATTAGIQLFSNNVECASCHKVHDNAIAPFLRVTLTGSALCTACHVK
jgi:predicted CXXCH cytochrome family protein